MKRLIFLLFLVVLLSAACGGEESSEEDIDVSIAVDDADAAADGNGVGSGAETDGADSESNDEDAAEVVGNPDLDLEELAEVAPDVAEALDGIDDVVSIGDCRSELVGLEMTYIPDGWQCRVLDAPVGGLDGFSLFKPENAGGIEITIGTPSPIGPVCEVMQTCDQTQPLDLGANFNVEFFEFGGIPFVFGTHVSVEAELAVTSASALSEDDLAFITMVLDGVVEI